MDTIFDDEPANTQMAGDTRVIDRAVLFTEQTTNGADGRRVLTVDGEDPADVVRAATGGRMGRALLGNGSRSDLKGAADPADTITQNSNQTGLKMLKGARVVALTPRALARFQTFPDWYELPAKKTLAVTIIGNAVPPLLAQRIVESLT